MARRVSVSLSFEAKNYLAAFNLAVCTILLIAQVYYLRNHKIKQPKIIATGLSVMVLAFLYCITLVSLQSEWIFGDIKWCNPVMKLSSIFYALLRIVLYIFIILRVEVVNQSNSISPRLILVCKAVIGVLGFVMVAFSIIFPIGVADEYSICSFDVTVDRILVPVFASDTFICIGGTWMFLRPIKKTLVYMDDPELRNTLRTTTIWSIVCLVSTLLATFFFAIVGGFQGVLGFDCNITSLGMLMMLPKGRKIPSKTSGDSSQVGTVAFAKTRVAEDKQFSGHIPFSDPRTRTTSSIRLEKMTKSFLSEDPDDSKDVAP